MILKDEKYAGTKNIKSYLNGKVLKGSSLMIVDIFTKFCFIFSMSISPTLKDMEMNRWAYENRTLLGIWECTKTKAPWKTCRKLCTHFPLLLDKNGPSRSDSSTYPSCLLSCRRLLHGLISMTTSEQTHHTMISYHFHNDFLYKSQVDVAQERASVYLVGD